MSQRKKRKPVSREKEKEQILKAYELVIADIAQDIGYKPGAQETTLSVLRGRVNELVNVWFADEKKEPELFESKKDVMKFVQWLFDEDVDKELEALAKDGTGADRGYKDYEPKKEI